MGKPLCFYLPPSFFRNPFHLSLMDRRSREKDFKKGSEFSNLISAQSRRLQRPQEDYFNGKLWFCISKIVYKDPSNSLAPCQRKYLSVSKNLIQRQVSHFYNFPLIYLLMPAGSHNPGYMLHLSASRGSWYFSWVFLLPFKPCVHVLCQWNQNSSTFLLASLFQTSVSLSSMLFLPSEVQRDIRFALQCTWFPLLIYFISEISVISFAKKSKYPPRK